MRRLSGLLCSALLGLACSSKSTPPTHQAIAGFEVAWTTTSTPSLTISAGDGGVLLASSGPIFESRTTAATWQEMFGAYLVSETDAGWNEPTGITVKSSSATEVVLEVAQSNGHSGTIQIASPNPGVLALTLTSDSQNRVRASFACATSDHFLGFGAQTDALDHHGHWIPIWTSEPGIGKTNLDQADPNDTTNLWYFVGTRHQASYPSPSFLSNHGYAFLADSTHRQIFDLCQGDPTRWTVETWDASVTLKVYAGAAPAASLELLTADLGRQPLANDLALAPWNDAVFGSASVRQIAAELRAAHIPSSALWTEDYRGGTFAANDAGSYAIAENWGVDRTLYPDIEQLSADLHAQGFRFFGYHSAFLHEGTDALAGAEDAGVTIVNGRGHEYDLEGDTFEQTSLVDLSTPAGASYIQSWLTVLLGYGFDGWMADFGEWMPVDVALADGSDPEAFHNLYPKVYHAISAATFAAQHVDPATSTYFTRSGAVRDAPNQPVVWGGDQLVSFDPNDGFPSALMRGLNLGLAGVAIYGSDIAGYQNQGLPPSTQELYFRWTTLGALSPVMRTHHGTLAKFNWRFDTTPDTTAHFARWSQLHAQLWPYLRVAAQEAFGHGMPIMRVLPLAYPDDGTAWTTADEYLFGPSLLVAPVLIEGATSRSIYFPADVWLPFWSGAPVTGPTSASVDLPITEIGLYARAGSIIPTLPSRLDTMMPVAPDAGLVTLDDVRTDRVLRVFAGANGTWTDLDGTTYTLTSASTDPVTGVKVASAAVSSCATGILPCADIDTTNRLVTVNGAGLTQVELDTATGSSMLAVAGATTVESVLFRY